MTNLSKLTPTAHLIKDAIIVNLIFASSRDEHSKRNTILETFAECCHQDGVSETDMQDAVIILVFMQLALATDLNPIVDRACDYKNTNGWVYKFSL